MANFYGPRRPLTSTEIAAQRILRMMEQEELEEAELRRLREVNWRAPGATASTPFADEGVFGDGRDALADLVQQERNAAEALRMEARRRLASQPAHSTARIPDTSLAGATSYLPPSSNSFTPLSKLYRPASFTPPPAGTPVAPAYLRLARNTPRVPTMPEMPPGLRDFLIGRSGLPGRGGYSEQQGAAMLRYWSALAAAINAAEESQKPSEQPEQPYFGGDGGLLDDIWGLLDPFPSDDDFPPAPDPTQAENIPQVIPELQPSPGDPEGPEPASEPSDRLSEIAHSYPNLHDLLVREGFLVYSKGSPETRRGVDLVAEAIIKALGARGISGNRTHGGTDEEMKERYFGDPDAGRQGSARSDGTIDVKGRNEKIDYNTADTLADRRSLAAREARAADNIRRLKKAIEERPDSFQTFPKSRGWVMSEWQREIDRIAEDLVETLYGPRLP